MKRVESPSMAVSVRSGMLNVFRRLLPIAALVFLFHGSVVQAFVIPSSSMEPTLQIGYRVIVSKLNYGFRLGGISETLLEYDVPTRGEIVVFTLPDNPATVGVDESNVHIIKRVVGLPGESLEVRGSRVFVNGVVLNENPANVVWRLGGRSDFGPVTVPPGSVFVMGDNRDFSSDSRYWTTPFLATNRIVGRAVLRYWTPAELL